MDALGLLYQRHGAAVRAVVLRADPRATRELADDICQETFLTFRRGVHRYDRSRDLRAWLLGIALHKARAWHRRSWRRLGLRRRHGSAASGTAPPPAAVDEAMHARQRIDRALSALPRPQREALVLVAMHGLTVQDAAAVLGISENAVSTRLYRARRSLEASR